MKPLDDLLRDPRIHRAVPDREMSDRVREHALARFRAGQTPAPERSRAPAPASREQLRRLTDRWLRLPRALRVLTAGLGALSLALVLSWAAVRVGWLPRVDILLKYWWRDISYSFGLSLAHAPLLMAAFLASAACWLGFLISAPARASLRSLRPFR